MYLKEKEEKNIVSVRCMPSTAGAVMCCVLLADSVLGERCICRRNIKHIHHVICVSIYYHCLLLFNTAAPLHPPFFMLPARCHLILVTGVMFLKLEAVKLMVHYCCTCTT
ncbi:unnamed protein product [Pylaiella littoralis]